MFPYPNLSSGETCNVKYSEFQENKEGVFALIVMMAMVIPLILICILIITFSSGSSQVLLV